MTPLRVVLLGRKKGACLAAELHIRKGHNLVAVVPSSFDSAECTDLIEFAKRQGARLISHDELHASLESKLLPPIVDDVDLVISFLHNRRIRPCLIKLPRIGCFNFHPAPLPELRGVGGYNFAILERMRYFGVSVHWVSPDIDMGNLVRVNRFPIDPDTETAWSLEQKAQQALLEIYGEFLEIVERGPIPSIHQGPGRYITRRQLEEAKRVLPGDTAEMVDRRARAFWFPPYRGAYVEVQGTPFTIVPDMVLKQLRELERARAPGETAL